MIGETHLPILPPFNRVDLPGNIPMLYRQQGSGPPLILIHGWGGSSDYWYQTMRDLADTYTCYAVEIPGYGNAPPMRQPASAERIADIIIAVADALDLPTFAINGHSFGGAVATYVAARAPKRVSRLVLTCFGTYVHETEQRMMTQAFYPTDLMLTISKPWLMMMQPWLHTWQCWWEQVGEQGKLYYDIARPFFHQFPPDEDVLREGFEDFMCMDYRSSLESAISLANPAIRDALCSLAVPTLLVGTRQDRMVLPSQVDGTAKLIPQSRLAWIDACGHIPMIECPKVYHPIIQAFLQG